MEDVLEVYHRPLEKTIPLVCMDEQPTQLVKEKKMPIAAEPGKPVTYDYEYERNGTANIFMFCAPLLGWRHINVTDRRTKQDWAHQIRELVDVHFPDAEKICLVMDNLNTHKIGSLYETFPPEEALRLAQKLEIHYTPKHGSWLNIAECELSALTRQCLSRRIPDKGHLKRETKAWFTERNEIQTIVDWQFRTADARIKLRSLYPKI